MPRSGSVSFPVKTLPSKEQFESSCGLILAPLLDSHGFAYRTTFTRPRGVALEFRRARDFLFVTCEGGVVVIDSIRRVGEDGYWRVCLNQALWLRRVRTLEARVEVEDKLRMFRRELTRHADLLAPPLHEFDKRCCFPLTGEQLRDYLARQRGVDEAARA